MAGQCHVCQLNSSQAPRQYSSWPLPSGPWERVHLDYAGPFLDKMWLIVVDAFSKFPFVVKMTSSTSTATIAALRLIFSLEGLPKTLVTDNGTQFVSKEFEQFCEMHAVNHLTSAPFNPESNGLAERMVRTFKTALKKILEDEHNDESALQVFLSTYRT